MKTKLFWGLLGAAMTFTLTACGNGFIKEFLDRPSSENSLWSREESFEEDITDERNYEIEREEEKDKDKDKDKDDDMRLEFKEAMDAYEEFYDEYCDLIKRYQKDPTNLELLTKYADMLTKAAEMSKKFEEWDQAEMNEAELKYYLEVNNRVLQKLFEIAQ